MYSRLPVYLGLVLIFLHLNFCVGLDLIEPVIDSTGGFHHPVVYTEPVSSLHIGVNRKGGIYKGKEYIQFSLVVPSVSIRGNLANADKDLFSTSLLGNPHYAKLTAGTNVSKPTSVKYYKQQGATLGPNELIPLEWDLLKEAISYKRVVLLKSSVKVNQIKLDAPFVYPSICLHLQVRALHNLHHIHIGFLDLYANFTTVQPSFLGLELNEPIQRSMPLNTFMCTINDILLKHPQLHLTKLNNYLSLTPCTQSNSTPFIPYGEAYLLTVGPVEVSKTLSNTPSDRVSSSLALRSILRHMKLKKLVSNPAWSTSGLNYPAYIYASNTSPFSLSSLFTTICSLDRGTSFEIHPNDSHRLDSRDYVNCRVYIPDTPEKILYRQNGRSIPLKPLTECSGIVSLLDLGLKYGPKALKVLEYDFKPFLDPTGQYNAFNYGSDLSSIAGIYLYTGYDKKEGLDPKIEYPNIVMVAKNNLNELVLYHLVPTVNQTQVTRGVLNQVRSMLDFVESTTSINPLHYKALVKDAFNSIQGIKTTKMKEYTLTHLTDQAVPINKAKWAAFNTTPDHVHDKTINLFLEDAEIATLQQNTQNQTNLVKQMYDNINRTITYLTAYSSCRQVIHYTLFNNPDTQSTSQQLKELLLNIVDFTKFKPLYVDSFTAKPIADSSCEDILMNAKNRLIYLQQETLRQYPLRIPEPSPTSQSTSYIPVSALALAHYDFKNTVLHGLDQNVRDLREPATAQNLSRYESVLKSLIELIVDKLPLNNLIDSNLSADLSVDPVFSTLHTKNYGELIKKYVKTAIYAKLYDYYIFKFENMSAEGLIKERTKARSELLTTEFVFHVVPVMERSYKSGQTTQDDRGLVPIGLLLSMNKSIKQKINALVNPAVEGIVNTKLSITNSRYNTTLKSQRVVAVINGAQNIPDPIESKVVKAKQDINHIFNSVMKQVMALVDSTTGRSLKGILDTLEQTNSAYTLQLELAIKSITDTFHIDTNSKLEQKKYLLNLIEELSKYSKQLDGDACLIPVQRIKNIEQDSAFRSIQQKIPDNLVENLKQIGETTIKPAIDLLQEITKGIRAYVQHVTYIKDGPLKYTYIHHEFNALTNTKDIIVRGSREEIPELESMRTEYTDEIINQIRINLYAVLDRLETHLTSLYAPIETTIEKLKDISSAKQNPNRPAMNEYSELFTVEHILGTDKDISAILHVNFNEQMIDSLANLFRTDWGDYSATIPARELVRTSFATSIAHELDMFNNSQGIFENGLNNLDRVLKAPGTRWGTVGHWFSGEVSTGYKIMNKEKLRVPILLQGVEQYPIVDTEQIQETGLVTIEPMANVYGAIPLVPINMPKLEKINQYTCIEWVDAVLDTLQSTQLIDDSIKDSLFRVKANLNLGGPSVYLRVPTMQYVEEVCEKYISLVHKGLSAIQVIRTNNPSIERFEKINSEFKEVQRDLSNTLEEVVTQHTPQAILEPLYCDRTQIKNYTALIHLVNMLAVNEGLREVMNTKNQLVSKMEKDKYIVMDSTLEDALITQGCNKLFLYCTMPYIIRKMDEGKKDLQVLQNGVLADPEVMFYIAQKAESVGFSAESLVRHRVNTFCSMHEDSDEIYAQANKFIDLIVERIKQSVRERAIMHYSNAILEDCIKALETTSPIRAYKRNGPPVLAHMKSMHLIKQQGEIVNLTHEELEDDVLTMHEVQERVESEMEDGLDIPLDENVHRSIQKSVKQMQVVIGDLTDSLLSTPI